MNAHKVLGLKVAMLVVAMLVALGGWQGVAYAQSTASFPHFTCYVITPKPSANAPLTLTDQFHPAPEGLNVVRRGPEFLCAPVLAKNGVALVQPTPPFDHLKCQGVVPASPGDGSLSFFGIVFKDARIARVRITSGNVAPGPDDGGKRDVVVMDDFIYGEPQALP